MKLTVLKHNDDVGNVFNGVRTQTPPKEGLVALTGIEPVF